MLGLGPCPQAGLALPAPASFAQKHLSHVVQLPVLTPRALQLLAAQPSSLGCYKRLPALQDSPHRSCLFLGIAAQQLLHSF